MLGVEESRSRKKKKNQIIVIVMMSVPRRRICAVKPLRKEGILYVPCKNEKRMRMFQENRVRLVSGKAFYIEHAVRCRCPLAQALGPPTALASRLARLPDSFSARLCLLTRRDAR